jgi:ribosomal protein S27E
VTSFDLDEFKRVKFYAVKCPKCKITAMVKAGDKMCPICASTLPKP